MHYVLCFVINWFPKFYVHTVFVYEKSMCSLEKTTHQKSVKLPLCTTSCNVYVLSGENNTSKVSQTSALYNLMQSICALWRKQHIKSQSNFRFVQPHATSMCSLEKTTHQKSVKLPLCTTSCNVYVLSGENNTSKVSQTSALYNLMQSLCALWRKQHIKSQSNFRFVQPHAKSMCSLEKTTHQKLVKLPLCTTSCKVYVLSGENNTSKVSQTSALYNLMQRLCALWRKQHIKSQSNFRFVQPHATSMCSLEKTTHQKSVKLPLCTTSCNVYVLSGENNTSKVSQTSALYNLMQSLCALWRKQHIKSQSNFRFVQPHATSMHFQ